MCGRFALGVDQQQLRLGIADYFPRLRGGGRGGLDPRRDRGGGGGDRGHMIDEVDEDIANEEHREAEIAGNGLDGREGLDEGGGAKADQGTAVDIAWEGEDRFRPKNWNVAPRSTGVVLRYRRDHHSKGELVDSAKADKGELVLETMQWGLIPHWSKHPPEGPLNTINARSENLTDPGAGGMWQSLKGPKRCVVVVQGYYEWQKKGTAKIPHFTRLAPNPSGTRPLMLIAGLYDTVTYTPTPSDPSPSPISTFTILTTTPCESLKWLHDRMPVILDGEEDLEMWLDCRDGWNASVAKLLRPYEGKLECYPVQAEVGKVGTNSSSYILPVAERKDGIASFFKKQESKSITGKTSSQSPKEKTGEVDTKDPGKLKEEEKVHHPATEVISAKPSVTAELKAEVLDEGIGDDSNAPQTTKVEEEDMETVTRSGTKKRAASQLQKEGVNDRKVENKKVRTRTGDNGKTKSKPERKQDEEIVLISDEDEDAVVRTRPSKAIVNKSKGQGSSSSPRQKTPMKTKEKGQSSIESFLK